MKAEQKWARAEATGAQREVVNGQSHGPQVDAVDGEDMAIPTRNEKARPIRFIVLKDVLFWGSVLISGLSLFLLIRWVLG